MVAYHVYSSQRLRFVLPTTYRLHPSFRKRLITLTEILGVAWIDNSQAFTQRSCDLQNVSRVCVYVGIGVSVRVTVGIFVGVSVGAWVGISVDVFVGVAVSVAASVAVGMGVSEGATMVSDGVNVGYGVVVGGGKVADGNLGAGVLVPISAVRLTY